MFLFTLWNFYPLRSYTISRKMLFWTVFLLFVFLFDFHFRIFYFIIFNYHIGELASVLSPSAELTGGNNYSGVTSNLEPLAKFSEWCIWWCKIFYFWRRSLKKCTLCYIIILIRRTVVICAADDYFLLLYGFLRMHNYDIKDKALSFGRFTELFD